ncbi:MAG TPA: DUF4926 domain-containing protein [Leptospiraceae bacterium]|nr:DUF4926 domain-containing protein [Leptospiraceae bacterium]HMY68892.1 DUF4926 domain-containing protein [Leptospiraceae bacterium]HMZ57541.1 DUF4926 domain-containing protein [Leptospiraceae bacterium]HNF15194.1 DUF4926 domain-containing protein [Leptospiraceae bacterium]HNN03722.1 DUF4926 domain-containing protein [Leptospiraceae bacterium]
MSYELYTEAALKKAIPKTKFRKGDLGTIIEIEKNSEGNSVFLLEFFSVTGQTLGTFQVSEDFIEPLRDDCIVNMRKL